LAKNPGNHGGPQETAAGLSREVQPHVKVRAQRGRHFLPRQHGSIDEVALTRYGAMA